MKKLFLLVFSLSFICVSAQTNFHTPNNTLSESVSCGVVYHVGNESLGYPIEIKFFDDSELKKKEFPLLQYFLKNKRKYIGGKLFDKTLSKETTITDFKVNIYYEKNEKQAEFVVVGKSFSCTITTINGFVLEETEKQMLFVEVTKTKESVLTHFFEIKAKK